MRFLFYICIELFDEMQSAAVQRSYMVAKSLPTTFPLSTQRCHSDRYAKISYPCKDNQFHRKPLRNAVNFLTL